MPLSDMKVQVKNEQLLEILRKNLEAHKKAHQEAVEGWEHEVVKACGLIMASVEEHKLKNLDQVFEHRQRPKSYAKEYELAIAMVEYNAGTVVELDQHDFDRYVRDNWEWKEQWTSSNSAYSRSR